jgi:hypothetical protein
LKKNVSNNKGFRFTPDGARIGILIILIFWQQAHNFMYCFTCDLRNGIRFLISVAL